MNNLKKGLIGLVASASIAGCGGPPDTYSLTAGEWVMLDRNRDERRAFYDPATGTYPFIYYEGAINFDNGPDDDYVIIGRGVRNSPPNGEDVLERYESAQFLVHEGDMFEQDGVLFSVGAIYSNDDRNPANNVLRLLIDY